MDEYTPQAGRPVVPARPNRRRIVLPLVLFVATCLSTFWAGVTVEPTQYLAMSQDAGNLMPIRRAIVSHYMDGLTYMFALLGILFAHEMGHFIATLLHGVPASLPYFLPLPITPIGTLGAVIGIDGRAADRRQIFDIGLAGPLAGLVVAIPVMVTGICQLHLRESNGLGMLELEMPLGISLLLSAIGPANVPESHRIWLGHLQGNPLFIAGWVGFLITGLNMVPVSQLDGGHVLYCLFGKRAHWIARALLLAVGVQIVWVYVTQKQYSPWILMALLVLIMGPDHPPTRNDRARLGVVRTVLGLLSLAIPVLCLPVQPFRQ